MYLFNFYEEKMLVGDFDMNSMPRDTDSLKDVFKQTMLDQDIIFRKQVCELHRLYSVQKTLMKDLTTPELEKYNSWKANLQSFPQKTRLPTNSIPLLDSGVSSSLELLEGWKDNNYKYQPRPFDRQLVPDRYIRLGDNNNLPKKVKVGDHLKETLGVNSVHDGGFSDPLELRLSLSLGVAKGKKEDKQRSRCDKKTNTFSRVVIDLEESTERTSDEDAKNSPFDFAAKVTYFGGKHDSQVAINSNPITSGCMKKDLSYKIAETSSFVGDRNYQDWSDSDQGLKCHRNMLHKNLLTRKQQFTSCGMGNVDLNEVQLDDLSCESDDAIVVNPLMTSSSCGFSGLVSKNHEAMCPIILWGKEIKEFPNGTSEMIQQEDGVKLDLINSNNKDRRTEVQVRNSEHCGRNECGISLNNPASESSPRINMPEDRCSHGGITKKGRDELILKLQNGSAHGLNPACFVATQFGCEKTEEEENVSIYSDKVQITIEDEHHDASPHSGKSSCISDNDSSPIRTMESGIQSCNSTIPASDQFSGTHGRPKVAETLSGEQDQRSSGSNEMKHECCYNREESAEVDDLIHIAAESLIHISLESSACYQESSTQAASNELENEDKEQPQRSIDSFELMTLEQAETGADEYSVTSKPFEVSDGQTKDFGIKLRRGRRLKDFQKDILPGLASLSRHEICEDKNILEGVLRSREYKKMRAKMAIGENWCTPVRSRQSRLNYVGRKTFR
ncbi:hypothetical protein ERO13_A08G171000v2 [Gossypium hirsutum]|uniref:Uncharacterized protein LOC107905654 n=1 Tax=Gossypium hirsutum TaxID=3635 RepID=A0A1U8JC19_GOSHI|nr:uncharacterized protein LOC107905654 [Gossypium hirsutum]XP_016687841.1 uncharacterized protein LOC107905654 [Gossypium hirsutum]XP_016687843.1 uncharacterized protein LOC107905654 [Gossypium hirsutum]XP_040930793.1 uncharacterized protein LOC107905654 [Gossypium hirsutum]XP_040930794.1 uncharacterized protein LOC107905654 [Gossypium hirsutum]XP_040930796.1 uncharacterized protein LOC107905654 [Gossypium hirsutum]KAG4188544.1 hypothetical protein ERO13_A08G171000v2 [Gossypium hirsutum]KAG